jgi:hypothetical protein
MEEPKIRKYGRFRFAVSYESIPEFILRLNFEPIITKFDLNGSFTLLHWQAKPRGLRRWGAFCRQDESTSYKAFEEYTCNVPYQRGIQLDERLINTVPTAVILFPECECIVDDAVGKIVTIGEKLEPS